MIKQSKKFWLTALCGVALSLGAAAPALSQDALLKVTGEKEDLSTFTELVEAAELKDDLESAEAVTVFAPNNKAFEKLNDEQREYLTSGEGKDLLESILRYHVVVGSHASGDLKSGKLATLAADETLNLKVNEGNVRVANAKVVEADVEAENGVVHVIDKILVPKSAELSGTPLEGLGAKKGAGKNEGEKKEKKPKKQKADDEEGEGEGEEY